MAYLAYYLQQNHPREVLIEMLWPEVEPQVGRHRLSMALSSLRRQLEQPGVTAGSVLQADRFAIHLNPAAITTDVAEFEEALRQNDLQRAVELYRGPLLPGYYEEWIVPEMLSLEERYTLARQQWESLQKGTRASLPIPVIPKAEPPTPNTHLPLQFTRFFGREDEIAQLCRWAAETLCDGSISMAQRLKAPANRLITLTGPGGSGKTRLAIQAARQMDATFSGGLWFVPLADLFDPRLIPGMILDALRLPRTSASDPLDQVMGYLNAQHGPVCLLLDNLEHLLSEERRKSEDGAAVVRSLLERTPRLTCLVTSRQRLDLEGEREYPVLPLQTPDTEHQAPEHLMQFASVQMFVDRAQAIKPDFQITDGPRGNAAAVAQLCVRLEGIPLAIELAAVRVQVLTPAQMLSQLDQRFDFLVSRRRDAIDRHRTLRAAIDWSYRLLSPDLQRFFARLSVFRGGWNVEAAKKIGEEPLALDSLAQLQEASLVLTEAHGTEMRFRMYETLREYARERLSPEERTALSRQHLDYFLALAEMSQSNYPGWNQQESLARLEIEHDNLRAALDWCSTEESDIASGLQLGGDLQWFWTARGYLSEGRQRLAQLLSRPMQNGPTSERACALYGLGALASLQGDYTAARSCLEECVVIYRALNAPKHLAGTMTVLGNIAADLGDYASARSHFEASLATHRQLGDRRNIALLLVNLGWLNTEEGNYTEARSLLEESLATSRELGDILMVGAVLNNLGQVCWFQGDPAISSAFFQQSLEICRELEDRLGIGQALSNLGNIALFQEDFARSLSLFEEGLAIRRELGDQHGIVETLIGLTQLTLAQSDLASAQAFLAETLNLLGNLRERHSLSIALALAGTLAVAKGHKERAVCLWGMVKMLREALGALLPPHDQEDYRRQVSAVQAEMEEPVFEALWNRGRAMTLEQAVTYALEET